MSNSTNLTFFDLTTNNGCPITDVQSILAIIVHCIIIFIGASGNSLILFVFKPKRKQSRYDLLIWYLSLFDLSGVIFVIVDVYETFTCHRHWPFGWLGCKTLYPCYYLSINMSVCVLLLIAVDRYRCLVTPFKKKFSTTNIHCAVFASLSFCMALQWYQFETLFIKVNETTGYIRCVQNRDSLMYLLPRFITVLLRDVGFIVIFSATTYKINIKMIERNRRNLLNEQLLDSSLKPRKKRARVRRTFLMITIMGITFGLLVFPLDALECTLVVSRLMPRRFRLNITSSVITADALLSTLQMCNSIVNCFIYSKMHRYFNCRLRRWNILPCIKVFASSRQNSSFLSSYKTSTNSERENETIL